MSLNRTSATFIAAQHILITLPVHAIFRLGHVSASVWFGLKTGLLDALIKRNLCFRVKFFPFPLAPYSFILYVVQ